jgi:hypothetical protein
MEDFRKTRWRPNRRAEAHVTHMAHSSSIRVVVNTKSVHFNTTCVMGNPNLVKTTADFSTNPYMAHPLYSGLSLIRQVGMGISFSALSNHTVTISRPDRSGNLLQLFVRLTFGVVVVHIRL